MTAPQAAWTVKLRWARGVWTSPRMTQHEAEQLAESLRAQVRQCGDGPDFVDFVTRDGRTVSLRGREAVAIEHGTSDLPERAPRGGVVGSVTVHGDGGPITGTDFLRQMVGRSPEQAADSVVRP